MKTTSFVSAAALVATAAAHGGVVSYKIGSPAAAVKGFAAYNSPTGQVTPQREWDSYNPIQDPTLASMACNAAGTPSETMATIAAGSDIVAYWNNPWPHAIGPLVVWMADCGASCATFTPGANAWFKIDQAGLLSGDIPTGLWGEGKMINDNSTWTSTIPATLKAGNYLIRHEVIAIHTSNQPQWYPECLQVTVTGSGSATPDSSYMASIPGVYQMSDPEIDIDVYSMSGVTTYTIPGPDVWTG